MKLLEYVVITNMRRGMCNRQALIMLNCMRLMVICWDQFLCDGVNQREDQYGGSLANRCRFLFEVVTSLIEIFGVGKVGVRLSPLYRDEITEKIKQSYFGVTCSEANKTYDCAVAGLNGFDLAYLLLTEPRVGGLSQTVEQEEAYYYPMANRKLREIYQGTLIGAGGFTPDSAAQAVADGVYDCIAFGRWFLATQICRNGFLPDIR